MASTLFTPATPDKLQLQNRIVMATIARSLAIGKRRQVVRSKRLLD